MRSIRLSLILCILLLLVLSLGAVSGLVYWMTARSFADEHTARQRQLETEYALKIKFEQDSLDKALKADALALSGSVGVQIRFPDGRMRRLDWVGALSALPTPHGNVQSVLWFYRTNRNYLSGRIHSMRVRFQFNDIVLPPEAGHIARYFQINTAMGAQWRSDSLKEKQTSFAFMPKAFGNNLFEEKFSTVELEKDVEVRLVQLKVSRFPVDFPRRRRLPRSPSPSPPTSENAKPRTPRPTRPGMTIYIQAAAETDVLKKNLATLKQAHDKMLADLEQEYQGNLQQLRMTLLFINLGTLAAALLLACWLVHLGLAPLRRLSDAVSRVSEKDFHLRLHTKELPTELHLVTDRLHQTLDLLQRAFAREKQAAADISHELRTPLSAMMMTLELGLRKQREPDEYRELLEECQEAGNQMSHLVERLLALARLDAGTDNLRPREVDVAHLANQCASLVRPLAEARGLKLSVQTNGAATIKADPDKIREVLTNLLHNAIEYNKPEGSVEVAVGRENDHLNMQVRDTGIGIPADATAHIFERFYRQDTSRHAECAMHAGIGLALVKGYVDLMGGRISVDSVVGEGSTFCIQLPIDEPPSLAG